MGTAIASSPPRCAAKRWSSPRRSHWSGTQSTKQPLRRAPRPWAVQEGLRPPTSGPSPPPSRWPSRAVILRMEKQTQITAVGMGHHVLQPGGRNDAGGQSDDYSRTDERVQLLVQLQHGLLPFVGNEALVGIHGDDRQRSDREVRRQAGQRRDHFASRPAKRTRTFR